MRTAFVDLRDCSNRRKREFSLLSTALKAKFRLFDFQHKMTVGEKETSWAIIVPNEIAQHSKVGSLLQMELHGVHGVKLLEEDVEREDDRGDMLFSC